MWKYESCDWENIALHDNVIDRICLNGNDILLVFDDGFDVVKTHHLNDTGKSKHTTASQIILKNGVLKKGIVFRDVGKDKQRQEEKIDLSWLMNFPLGIDVARFKVENNVLILDSYKITYDNKVDFLTIEISSSDVLFCWDDYSSDAWFEGWPKNIR